MIPNSLLLPSTGANSPSRTHYAYKWNLLKSIGYLIMHTLGHKQFLSSIYTHNPIFLLYSSYTHNLNTAMTKEREINPRSLENLKLGAIARNKNKIRRNTTLLPETIQWLDSRGNASDLIDKLVEAAKSGKLKPSNTYESNDNEQHLSSDNTHNKKTQQVEALTAEIEQLRSQLSIVEAERDQLRSQLENQNLIDKPAADLESDRDRFLANRKLGKQSPEYKRTKKAVDQFIAFVQST